MNESFHIQHQEVKQPVTLSRRQTLKWFSVMAAGISMPLISGCDSVAIPLVKMAGGWPDLKLEPITGNGYGTDPDLINPPKNPWPFTMTPAQRELAAVLFDIIIPAEGGKPSASQIGMVDVLDQWVSAPYESFHSDRVEILSGLAWLDQESLSRFDKIFVKASNKQQLEIIEDVAYVSTQIDPRYIYMANVFDGIRTLTIIAYFCSPQGEKELGYQGNVPIMGDYPGPTKEATQHLDKVLADLGLSEYAYKD